MKPYIPPPARSYVESLEMKVVELERVLDEARAAYISLADVVAELLIELANVKKMVGD